MANRLKNEQSPYLLQHADNPVNWRPWGDEAFAVAEKADKPIFLSIGYSTCRWCHVMARESFEDAEVARLMNETFICIKVDREERPDVDAFYMSVCRLLTGSGGWPLTIVMAPDKKPFFAATYIPKRGRFGQAGMLDLIPRLGEMWKSKRGALIDNAEKIIEELRKESPCGSEEKLEPDLLDEAYRELRTRYDGRHGGFGDAPKFPMPHTLSFLLRYWNRTGSADALEMVEQTLQAMRRGGIYDHVGFGFHRYATDRAWILPHFEKMLYDQALLSIAYTEAFQLTRKAEYESTAREILTYVLRNLKSEEGGFYCAEDAESEGKEGKFYLWTEQEIRRILDPHSAALLIKIFHVEPGGNFSDEANGEKSGKNILYRTEAPQKAALSVAMDERQLHEKITNALGALFRAREKRIRPHLDDKILTDWNGLMIAALAYAARAFENQAYLDAAQNAAAFVLNRLRDGDGRLLHRFRAGHAGIRAFLDDYAFLVWGLIEIYESGFDPAFLKTALELNAQMVRNFRDDRAGGFFFTAAGDDGAPVRKKDIYDGAIPSGNSVAMLNLLRLAGLTGDSGLEETAAEIPAAFMSEIARMPSSHCFFLIAADFALGPSLEIVVAGKKESPETIGMLQALQSRFIPNKVVLLRETGRETGISDLAEFIRPMSALDGKTTAYVCTGHACAKPVTSAAEMMELLKER